MEKIEIRGKEYNLLIRGKWEGSYLKGYIDLAYQAFHQDFTPWFEGGYFDDTYIPYTLLDGERPVANVAASAMDFIWDGKSRKYVLIGTVMTDLEYRNRGLIRVLMDRIFQEWQGRCDMIYLFAKNAVVDFYPKFGFRQADETQWAGVFTGKKHRKRLRKLDLNVREDQELFRSVAFRGNPYSRIQMKNMNILYLNGDDMMKGKIYYLEEPEAVVVLSREEKRLRFEDIYCGPQIPMEKVLEAVLSEDRPGYVLRFPVRDREGLTAEVYHEEQSTLFLMGPDAQMLIGEQICFPAMTHA